MKDTDHRYCSILLDVLQSHGVKHIVASPGSRNAPLLISCSYRPELNVEVIGDERDAAFFALGIAMVSRKPVALICTSGTALYNYAPAVAEAFYQGIPLIVISADRPFYWIGQEDSQTLIQPDALGKIIKKSFDIPVETQNAEVEWYVNRVANEAVILASESKPGPVHVNIQIEAPLSGTLERAISEQRVFRTIAPVTRFHPTALDELTEKIAGKRVMVVAGFMPPDSNLNKQLLLFSSLPGVKVFCETLSNIHLPGNPYAIDSVISGLTEEMKERLRPDIVIVIGGALVSRMLKEYIRKMKPDVWTLGDSYFGNDGFKNLSLNIRLTPDVVFRALYFSLQKYYRKMGKPGEHCAGYLMLWDDVKARQLAMREKYVKDCEWSELKAFHYILENLPRDYNLYLSNGTSVRYAQLFTDKIPHASYSNRGVSGIDGTTATAAGCAYEYKGKTLLITGDLSFAYSPGVLGFTFLPPSFKIIVINNKGGGIFRFISPTRYIEHRNRFFCADPNLPVRKLCEAYGWNYFRADSEEQMPLAFKSLLDDSHNAVLEIISDEEYSASLLRKYMRLNFEQV